MCQAIGLVVQGVNQLCFRVDLREHLFLDYLFHFTDSPQAWKDMTLMGGAVDTVSTGMLKGGG